VHYLFHFTLPLTHPPAHQRQLLPVVRKQTAAANCCGCLLAHNLPLLHCFRVRVVLSGLVSAGVTAARVLPRVLDAEGFSAGVSVDGAAAIVTVPLDRGLRQWVALFLREAVRDGRWGDGFSLLRRLWRKLGCPSSAVESLDFSVRAPWDVRSLSAQVSALLHGYVVVGLAVIMVVGRVGWRWC